MDRDSRVKSGLGRGVSEERFCRIDGLALTIEKTSDITTYNDDQLHCPDTNGQDRWVEDGCGLFKDCKLTGEESLMDAMARFESSRFLMQIMLMTCMLTKITRARTSEPTAPAASHASIRPRVMILACPIHR